MKRQMRLILTLAVVATLAGCAGARMSAARDQLVADKNACREAPKTTYLALAQCMNAAERKAHSAGGFGDADLLELRLASRSAIAEKQDRKQLTEAEAELEFAQINAQIGSEGTSRDTRRQSANAQSSAAAAANIRAMNQSVSQPVFTPTFQPQQPQQSLRTNCRSYMMGNEMRTDCQ